jgi:hypothetical protein
MNGPAMVKVASEVVETAEIEGIAAVGRMIADGEKGDRDSVIAAGIVIPTARDTAASGMTVVSAVATGATKSSRDLPQLKPRQRRIWRWPCSAYQASRCRMKSYFQLTLDQMRPRDTQMWRRNTNRYGQRTPLRMMIHQSRQPKITVAAALVTPRGRNLKLSHRQVKANHLANRSRRAAT